MNQVVAVIHARRSTVIDRVEVRSYYWELHRVIF